MRVALIYGSNQPAGNYLLGISAYQANFTSQYDQLVFVKKAPGVSTAAALAAIKAVTRDYPGTTVQNQAQFMAQTTQPINQILNLVYVLLLLTVIIALLGIGNTLALSIYERIREIGLLRAVGMEHPGFGGDSILPEMLWSGWPLSSTVPPHGGTTV